MFKPTTVFVVFAMVIACNGIQQNNYDISRKRTPILPNGIDDVNYALSRRSGPGGAVNGGGYGHPYPGGYHPGGYHPGSHGPPGAHPGCPLCDSSVYSYCSYKQSHDSCCCDHSDYYKIFGCRSTDCGFIYANTCEEYNLISRCCCIDLYKNAEPVPVVV